MQLDAKFKSDPTFCKVIALDYNNDTNKGLIRCYKVQLHIIDQLVFNVLNNHLTTSSYGRSCNELQAIFFTTLTCIFT
jgi:hypothetical protein